MSLVPVDPKNEASVVMLLERVHDWLATAIERSDASEIAAVKAQIATAAEATKQLNLSKEIQLDAQEMVRRAEYALGKAIRKGQAEGLITTKSDGAAIRDGILSPGVDKVSPRSIVGGRSKEYQDINTMVAAENFDGALAEAKGEGNMSRANVVRKIKGQRLTAPSANGVGTIRSPALREQRAELIAELAAQGYSSRQMPAKVGVAEDTVRQIARDFDIEIPADRSVSRTRRINSAQVVENTATALEGLVVGVQLVDYDAVDPVVAAEWSRSIKDSLKILNAFGRRIEGLRNADNERAARTGMRAARPTHEGAVQ